MKSFELRKNSALANIATHCGRAAVTGTLCGLMIVQPLAAEGMAPGSPKKTVTARIPQIQGEDRVLHALNRLTFGPRPGDVAAVEKMGLDKWFEQQLNPQSINDSALDARLAQYPAMNLTLAELENRFPGPQELKALAAGRGQLPTDPTERAMVTDQVAYYKIERQKIEAAQPTAGQPTTAQPSTPPDAGAMQAPPAAQTSGQTGGMAPADMSQANSMDAAGDTAMTPATPAPAKKGKKGAANAVLAGGPIDRAAERVEVEKLVALEPQQRFDAIMAMTPAQLAQVRQALGPATGRLIAGLTPQQREILVALPGSQRMIALETLESRMERDIYSDRQLEAVMTDFWLNHFNVYIRKNQNEPYLLPAYERETIRPHALGKFEDLLVATAESPAMLVYLDNFRSVGPDSPQAQRIKAAQQMNPDGKVAKQVSAGLNENYGRELMELHTLGVNGGYTQADVTMVAKVFTGWGLDYKNARGNANFGDFNFEERRHEPGPKTVLGKTIQENGQKEGLEVLHMLATSPATAHFISKKLAIRFVSDNPPQALVDRMADSFLKSDGDIKTVLRTMFHSPEFFATDTYRAKVKTPEEFVISAVRASGAEVANPQALVQALDRLGQGFYGMQTPNGYSWTQDGWVSTGALVSRMNFALILSDNRLPGVSLDWAKMLGEPGGAAVVPASYTPDAKDPTAAKEKKLEQVLLGDPVSEKTRATVIGQSGNTAVTDQAATQFDLTAAGARKGNYVPRGLRNQPSPTAGPDDAQAAVMAGLLLGSPEFQRR